MFGPSLIYETSVVLTARCYQLLRPLLTSLAPRMAKRPPQVRAHSFIRFLRYLLHALCWPKGLWSCGHSPNVCSLLYRFCSSVPEVRSLASFSACLTTNHLTTCYQAIFIQHACERLSLSEIIRYLVIPALMLGAHKMFMPAWGAV